MRHHLWIDLYFDNYEKGQNKVEIYILKWRSHRKAAVILSLFGVVLENLVKSYNY